MAIRIKDDFRERPVVRSFLEKALDPPRIRFVSLYLWGISRFDVKRSAWRRSPRRWAGPPCIMTKAMATLENLNEADPSPIMDVRLIVTGQKSKYREIAQTRVNQAAVSEALA